MKQDGPAQYAHLIKEKHREAGLISAEGFDRMLITSYLVRIFHQLSRDIDAHHRQFGWTWAGFRVVNVLWAEGDLEVRELADRTGSSRAAISSVVNTLEANGIVRRLPVRDDRRLVVIALTQRGLAQLERAIAEQAELEREWFSHLSTEQQHCLAELLELVADRKDCADGSAPLN